MKRAAKKVVLAACAAGYVVAAGFYVYFWLAVSSWGGAWCDNGPSCGAADDHARLLPAEQALLEVIVVGIVLLIVGTLVGSRWLSQPKN